ncbi:MAG: hypothetical protein QOG86_1009 [Thermoleophilaceae bacterium]|nr:hypothetical protein [Thermoleophilaceae bacterium]
MEVDTYRAGVEQFMEELEREYVLHLSGRKVEFEIEPIYERHAALFERDTALALRAGAPRELARFAAEGHIGQAVKAETAEIARREATLTVELDGAELPYRQASIAVANEPDPDRRAALEAARLAVMDTELNPLHVEAHERAAALARELGFASTLALCEELGGLDLRDLGRQCEQFLAATEPWYDEVVAPELERELGFGFERFRRSDIAALMRAPGLDWAFPGDRLVESYERTLAGLGLDGGGVLLDLEERPNKSPRAFCAIVRVPDEVHLVIARIGGRDDYEALMHEAGHAQHYSRVERELPAEARLLGDASVTEGFAFLFQHLISSPPWLEAILGVTEPRGLIRHTQATRLLMLRRYAGKLLYELELHGGELDGRAPERYGELLSNAVHVEWQPASWLTDVDAFFYAARYLRAWAFETHLRRVLADRFGPSWFAEPEAGAVLRSLWREGQARTADELLDELTGERLDLAAVARDLAPG